MKHWFHKKKERVNLKIFVLEDQDYKYEDLEEAIIKECGNDVEIVRFKYLNPARRHVRQNKDYDLFIVDMQTAYYKDKPFDINTQAGRLFIMELKEQLNVDISKAFIFSSEEPKEDEELDWITYDAMSSCWRESVVNKIESCKGGFLCNC